jgi:hypothetical protein
LTPGQNLECGKSVANLVRKFQHIGILEKKTVRGRAARKNQPVIEEEEAE